MAPPRARNEGRDRTAEEHICRWEGRKCACVDGSESERACVRVCAYPHANASILACRCVMCVNVRAQPEARAPPGTCDHTQRSNIWQQTAELQLTNGLAAQAVLLQTRWERDYHSGRRPENFSPFFSLQSSREFYLCILDSLGHYSAKQVDSHGEQEKPEGEQPRFLLLHMHLWSGVFLKLRLDKSIWQIIKRLHS